MVPSFARSNPATRARERSRSGRATDASAPAEGDAASLLRGGVLRVCAAATADCDGDRLYRRSPVADPGQVGGSRQDRSPRCAEASAKLARYLRAGEPTAVWVPDEAHEALRDLVRLREDAKADQKRARNRLGKFLLRQGWAPPEGTKVWSRAHREWLDSL